MRRVRQERDWSYPERSPRVSRDARPPWVFIGWDGTVVAVRSLLAVEKVSRGRSTGGDRDRREGPNAKPSVRTFVVVAVAMIAANPLFGGLVGRV
jgi:hypothetical protein